MTKVTELDLPVFDYSAPDLTGEVYHRRLAEVREKGWLAQGPLSYIVLDREAGEFFLRSRATAFPGRQIADLFGITAGRLREQIDANILNQTGDRHRRLRALVGPAFTPRAADRWRPVMRDFLTRLWDEDADRHDFVAAVAKPYPSMTIAAVLGAPPHDAPRLQEWSNAVQRQFDVRSLSTDLAQIERACAEVAEYVEALLDERRAVPADDLLSALLAAEAEGDRLAHAECVDLVVNVLAGGVDTTQAQLAHSRSRCGSSRRTPVSGPRWPRIPAWPRAPYVRCCASSRSPRSPPGSASNRWSSAASPSRRTASWPSVRRGPTARRRPAIVSTSGPAATNAC
jgi:cytochrome P450